MNRYRLALAAVVLFAFEVHGQSLKPLSEINLSEFEYQGRPPVVFQELTQELLMRFGSWIYQQGVAFSEPKVVVAYFVVHDDPPGAAEPREPLLSDPFRLVAAFVNIANGALIKKLSWPLPANPNGVAPCFFFPASEGRFVVGLGNTLSLYSATSNLIAHTNMEAEMSPVASPSGTSLLLRGGEQVDGQWIARYELVDTQNLSVVKKWSEPSGYPPHQIQALWDDAMAWISQSMLYFKTSTSGPKELPANQGELCGAWEFVGKQNLAGPVCGTQKKLLTVSTEGKAIREFDLGLEQLDGPVVASANGQRFAVPTFRWGIGRNNQPDQLTARVFGLNSATPLLTLNVPPGEVKGSNYFFDSYGDTRFGWGGLALSQDGAHLAVKSGGKIQIYRVPDAAEANQCAGNCGHEAAAGSHPPQAPQSNSTALANTPRPSSQLIEQMLSWLPEDTQSVAAATGPLLMPEMSRQADGSMVIAKSDHEVTNLFKQFFLLLLMPLAENLKDEPMVAAIEGSRDFRAPTGLGMMRFQGSVIAVFAGDITARAELFRKGSHPRIIRTEKVEGCDVAVFEEKNEQDLATMYVAFPKPNIAVAATDRDYLREILARINGKHGKRALPDELSEWKHIDIHSQFWAVRHYRKDVTSVDGTAPFMHIPGTERDAKAIGLTFSFDPDKSNTANITYLSGAEDSLVSVKNGLFSEREQGVTQMHMQYREVAPGTLDGSYNLEQIESAQYFIFVLEGLLGHAIFL